MTPKFHVMVNSFENDTGRKASHCRIAGPKVTDQAAGLRKDMDEFYQETLGIIHSLENRISKAQIKEVGG